MSQAGWGKCRVLLYILLTGTIMPWSNRSPIVNKKLVITHFGGEFTKALVLFLLSGRGQRGSLISLMCWGDWSTGWFSMALPANLV